MHNADPLHPDSDVMALPAAQRLAAGIPHRATLLQGPFPALLYRISSLGVVTILTGNASAIQEKTGIYDHAAYQGAAGLAGNQPIHQRVFYQKWKYGFAVSDISDDDRVQRYLQFFDEDGNGVHKILLHEASRIDAFQQIVSDFAAAEQSPVLDVFRTVPAAAEDVATLDIDALRADWASIDDTEAFFARQIEFDRMRLHKLRFAGKAFAHQVANDSVRIFLQKLADLGSTVTTQVGNVGIVQAYQGRIKQICSIDSWLNILNPDYRLRLREDHIDTVWVAKKPTTDGIITSLELFNHEGVSIARFFSKPEPGKPEPREWRDSIMRLLPVFGA
jgi:putative hemin transport protein